MTCTSTGGRSGCAASSAHGFQLPALFDLRPAWASLRRVMTSRKKLLAFCAGAPSTSSPGRNIRHDAGLRADARPGTDGQMPGKAGLCRDHHARADRGRAGDAGLRDDHRIGADIHVMADLHEVIDMHARADHRVLGGAAVDGGVGADFRAIADQHPAQLRHRGETRFWIWQSRTRPGRCARPDRAPRGRPRSRG